MSRKLFFTLGIVTIVGFSGLGIALIVYFQERDIFSLLKGKQSVLLQLLNGFVYGILAGTGAWLIIKREFMKQVRDFFATLIQDLKLTLTEIIFISFCAGVGEEVLFRGAVQHWLGIWITSILFVALHGYINPKNLQISIYGSAMCIFIAGIGFLCEHSGLLSAISAHAIIDIILLYAMTQYKPET